MLEKGLVQIYTGDGKGKTTAAFGLAVRAAGRGNRVLIYQFLKPPSLELGERLGVERSGLSIRVESLEAQWHLFRSLRSEQDITAAGAAVRDALARLTELAAQRAYDVLILDEIVFCLSLGLGRFDDVRRLIEQRDPAVEIVLTGRGATPELIAMADLVTEMKKIKHPFDKGVVAREGMEY
ncbi:MAG TPA: cob(I)yrinic acid a,c-diamide adenosyltransferase [Sedimentisphaerales bacterium]|nr:cob(I)yrinic acid a,c-diamide adenosyltransferase [Sedimentisphaerales bacterium]